jgi:hypothetical protein
MNNKTRNTISDRVTLVLMAAYAQFEHLFPNVKDYEQEVFDYVVEFDDTDYNAYKSTTDLQIIEDFNLYITA